MPPSGLCDAHELMVQNIQDVKKSSGQTYDLLREQKEESAEMRERLVHVEEGQAHMAESLKDFREAQEKQNLEMLAILRRGNKKWSPRTIIMLVSTVLGSGGIGAIVVKSLPMIAK